MLLGGMGEQAAKKWQKHCFAQIIWEKKKKLLDLREWPVRVKWALERQSRVRRALGAEDADTGENTQPVDTEPRDHRVKISFFSITYSVFEMFTRHWESEEFFSSLQVPDPKPTEEYGIFCADFTAALNYSPLERIGIPAKGHLQGKELQHPWGNGALQCKCLQELCSVEFPSSLISCIWEHGKQFILASLWTAECAEKSWRVNSIWKGLPCKEPPMAAPTAAFSQHRTTPSVQGHCQCIPRPFLSYSLSKDWNWTFPEAVD